MSQNDRIAEVHSYPIADLSDRGILPTIANYFGVKGDSGNTRHYYPYYKDSTFMGYKERVKATKEFYALGNVKKVDLFGQYQASASSSHRLIIVEGEMDALAAFQMIWLYQQNNEKFKDVMPAVVSVAHGASSAAADLMGHEEFLDRFKDIVLCFDQDKAGKTAEQEVLSILPIEKVKIARLPLKDANQMLLEGKEKEFVQEILFRATEWRPTTIKSVKEAYEQAIEMPKFGASFPFPTMTKLTQGAHPGDVIGVGAGVGIGKTTIWHKTIAHHIFKNNRKAGVIFLEEEPGDSLKNLATHHARKRFISAEGGFTQAELEAAIQELDGKVYLFEHDYHALRSLNPWDSVKQAIRHMVLVEGCNDIVVDPLTALVAQMTASEANDALNSIMAEVEAMAKTLQFTFYYGAHLNPPRTGISHEEGGRVYLSQFTGSRAMIKWSHIIIGLERNTQADSKEERNTTIIRMLKGRRLGQLDTFAVYFDDKTGSFDEINDYASYEPRVGGTSENVQHTAERGQVPSGQGGIGIPNVSSYTVPQGV
jgi:twinkle protein